MAHHILIKNQWLHSYIMFALNNRGSLKFNVEEEKNPKSRIDLDWIEQTDNIKINKEELGKAKVFYVEVFKPINKLNEILGEGKYQEMKSYHFEVFEFSDDYLVYWVI